MLENLLCVGLGQFLTNFSLRMPRNGQISTFGLKYDARFELSVSGFLKAVKFSQLCDV